MVPFPDLVRIRNPIAAPTADHDLPILAVELENAPRPDWEALLGDGVQPAIFLGAERRVQGRR